MNVQIICKQRHNTQKATGNNDSNNKQCQAYTYHSAVAITTKRTRASAVHTKRQTHTFICQEWKKVFSFIFIQYLHSHAAHTYEYISNCCAIEEESWFRLFVVVAAYSRRLPAFRRVCEWVPFTHLLGDCFGCVFMCFFWSTLRCVYTSRHHSKDLFLSLSHFFHIASL